MPQPLAQSHHQDPQNDPLQAVYAVQADRDQRPLPPAVRRILGHFDGRRSTAEALANARISEARGLAAIKKLTLSGYLRPAREALERADTLRDLPSFRELQRAGFSAEEEAFFASEVEPELDPEPPLSLGQRVGLYLADLRMRLTGSPA